MHVTDWLPTLLEAVGLDPPQGIDGISHWRAFKDGGQLTRKEMLYNFKNISGTYLIFVHSINSGASVKKIDWGEFFHNQHEKDSWQLCTFVHSVLIHTQCVILHTVCNFTHSV